MCVNCPRVVFVSLCVQCQGLDAGEEVCDEGTKGINEQASYAATKLRQLYDKLEYKRQALGSIQNAPKPDKKVADENHTVLALQVSIYLQLDD